MEPTLRPQDIADVLDRLTAATQRVSAAYPGDRLDRQPVHTVYGGAQLFSADVV